MSKFKVNDIVVVIKNNSIDFWRTKKYKDLSRACKINVITEITKVAYDYIYDDSDNDFTNSVNIKILNGSRDIRFLAEDLRLATQREQFLYYILGPHVLGEENEKV